MTKKLQTTKCSRHKGTQGRPPQHAAVRCNNRIHPSLAAEHSRENITAAAPFKDTTLTLHYSPKTVAVAQRIFNYEITDRKIGYFMLIYGRNLISPPL